MNEKQKKAVGLGAVALAALAIFSSQTADEPLPQGFSVGFPDSGTLGGGGVAREEPSLAEQLKNVFQPPPDLSGFTQIGPRVAQPSKYKTLHETGYGPIRYDTPSKAPESVEGIFIGGSSKTSKKDLNVAPSESFLEGFLGIEFKPAPSGSIPPKQVGTYTLGPAQVSYPGELKSPGFDFGGSTIGGIGQSTIPTKYVSGGSSSSPRKSSKQSYGPIRYDTPSKAPKNLEGVITGVISTPKSNSRKTKGGLTIRKTTAAERARSEKQRKAKLKIR